MSTYLYTLRKSRIKNAPIKTGKASTAIGKLPIFHYDFSNAGVKIGKVDLTNTPPKTFTEPPHAFTNERKYENSTSVWNGTQKYMGRID